MPPAASMKNIKLTIAYDGADFHGWQFQPGIPTIQGAIQDAARKITQERIVAHGASRTDTGVHALGQVAHFKTRSPLFGRRTPALSQRPAAAGNPYPRRRRSRPRFPFTLALAGQSLPLPPLSRPGSSSVRIPPRPALSLAARRGSHGRCGAPVRGPARLHLLCRIVGLRRRRSRPQHGAADLFLANHLCEPAGEEIAYVVRGKSFLRYMVRKMVGTIIEVGRGRLAAADIPRLFELRDRSRSGPTVPPEGLYLVCS